MKMCARCGQLINRRVMATAKYCSAECRQKTALEAYRARNPGKRTILALDAPEAREEPAGAVFSDATRAAAAAWHARQRPRAPA